MPILNPVVLDETVPITLTTDHEDLMLCAWHHSVEDIDGSDPALVFDEKGALGICLHAVEELSHALSANDDNVVRERLSEASYIAYEQQVSDQYCSLCEGTIETKDYIEIREPLFYSVVPPHSETKCFHVECRDSLCDVLDELWNHTDVMLSAQL